MLLVSLLVIFLTVSAWLWGMERFSITDAAGKPLKGRNLHASNEAGNPAEIVIYRDRRLFDALMTGFFSLSQALLWVFGAGIFGLVFALVSFPFSLWLLWKALRAPRRPLPL
jgi:hypothetical protein